MNQEIISYDAYNHMFFAKHYRENWFSLVNQQTGGGLDMRTYPPLAFQMMALLSLLTGYEWSYRILSLIFWILLTLYGTKFFYEYLNREKFPFYFYYLIMFFSIGLLKAIFVFGQYPTIVGFAFGFMAANYYLRFLRRGNERDFFRFGLALTLTAFSHHFSLIIVGIFLIVFSLLEHKSLINIKLSRKIVLIIVILSFVNLVTLYPFISSLTLESSIPKKEIIHTSREPLYDKLSYQQWIITTYGLSGIFILSPLFMKFLRTGNKGNYLKLYVIALIFFLFSLGRSTPMIKVFGNLEYWLTYDRFGLFASFVLSFLMADTILKLSGMVSARGVNRTSTVLLVLLLLTNLWGLEFTKSIFIRSANNDLMKNRYLFISDFLNNTNRDYRYQTFGYQDRISKLFLASDAPSLDTEYFTGQKIDWVREEGIETINDILIFNRPDFFHKFINKSDEYSIKYVIVADTAYNNLIERYNWLLIDSKYDVSIWENPSNISALKTRKEIKNIFNYLWGIIPMSMLMLYLLTLRRKINENMYDNRLPSK